MATQTIPRTVEETTYSPSRDASDVGSSIRWGLSLVLKAFASLKLTVTLFALAIFLVFVGTLAQAEKDMWVVLDEYFKSFIAYVHLRVFFPPSFFPLTSSLHREMIPNIALPFPGGKTIGLLMVMNLLAAHLVRFRVQGRGSRLVLGSALTALGVFVTWLVINSGHNKHGLQGEPFFEWHQFWMGMRVGLALVFVALIWPFVKLIRNVKQEPRYIEIGLLGATVAILAALQVWMHSAEFVPSASSLRILWQLVLGLLCGLLLWAGSVPLFARRAGIVVIHGGILLMMFGEFLVGMSNVEERMVIREGQTVQFADDIRTTELAVIDRSPADYDDEVVIPRELLVESASRQEVLSDPQLPFDVQVVEYHPNADIVRMKEGEKSPADMGLGTDYKAVPRKPGSGADANQEIDVPAAYVRFLDKQTGKTLGTQLVSLAITMEGVPQSVHVGDKAYEVCLRLKRSYKPYSMKLVDVVRENWQGTATPRDYASIIRLTDPERNIDREVRVWMNNPLRYAGETFYQSSYNLDAGGVETTVLQVVRNTGWMIPYVACMIVFVGLVAHFWGTLVRFLTRREQALFASDTDPEIHPPASARVSPYIDPLDRSAHRAAKPKFQRPVPERVRGDRLFPLAIAILGILWLTSRLLVPQGPDARGLDIHAFGKLPIHYEGRIKPMDTAARNSLRVLSNKETFYDKRGDRQPAIRWFLDVISDSDEALDHRVVRIDSLEVLDALGLNRRKGFLYSVNEIRPRIDEFQKQVDQAKLQAREDAQQLSHYQRKVLELDNRLQEYLRISAAFRTLPLPEKLPTPEEFRADMEKHRTTLLLLQRFVENAPEMRKQLADINPPLAIPPVKGDVWQPYASVWGDEYLAKIRSSFSEETYTAQNPAAAAFETMLAAYRHRDAEVFNREVAKYQEYVAANGPTAYQPQKVWYEAFYNYIGLFFHAQWAYLVAFLLAALGFAIWSRPLQRASFWLILLAFIAHTAAIASRIYISGRPPITNLYETAVFIGWGAVGIGLLLELLYPLGIGNFVGTAAGFTTLIIANGLAAGGETIPVLQAVLDTQFWLATHVVCIALGYCATLAAGLLGMVYVVFGLLSRLLDKENSRALLRMIYGTLCFALSFSFIGTVLGGLWADDSWGRFWGWDPKENGALIIVLWNALVLHARWDGMVRDRGLAVLAIGGNIVTSWSWFGVNELGVGLHSYGFTEGVLFKLGLFVLLNAVIIAVGLFPREMWRSEGIRQPT